MQGPQAGQQAGPRHQRHHWSGHLCPRVRPWHVSSCSPCARAGTGARTRRTPCSAPRAPS
uniref:Uncharacterized protein n=1 Tax=Arundo donax TaxID=35708 RepID=A0A0A9BHI6_ARUDO